MRERFPTEVSSVLREAGWSPGRHVEGNTAESVRIVCGQVGKYGARIEAFPAAIEALNEFGGLQVVQDGPGIHFRRCSFTLDPTPGAVAETLAEFGRLRSSRLFPLGFEGHYDSVLAIEESGWVFALDPTGEWYLGDTIETALTTLITGTQPPRVNEQGSWLC